MTAVTAPDAFGDVIFSPDEEWFEIGPAQCRRRIAFHDYAAIYAEQGLYERVFIDELGMRSTFEVVRLFGEVLAREGLDPAGQRVLDVGAGNGVGGQALRTLGVGAVVAVDLTPAAAIAAERDRPGVYERFVVGDLATEAHRFAADDLTAVVALSSIGPGHVPPRALGQTLDLLGPGGLYAFAVMPTLLPGSSNHEGCATGYPDFLADLLARTQQLARIDCTHRRQADGTPHEAVALVGRF